MCLESRKGAADAGGQQVVHETVKGFCCKEGWWCSGSIRQRLCEQVEGGDSSSLPSTSKAMERGGATGESPVKCH